MKRTQVDILEKIKDVEKQDWMGTQRNNLIAYLTFKNAKQFLKEDVKSDEWRVETKPPKKLMAEYMDFAWEKANDCRGLSAGRSLDHFFAWLWLDGNDELSNSILNYNYYGKPQLVEICEYLKIDSSKWDNGIRQNSED